MGVIMLSRVQNQPEIRTILVVDDDPDTCELLSLFLQNRGFSVKTSTSGNKALELLASSFFCLIILDMMMPEMDGWETYQRIRLQSKDVPVLFLTAVGSGDLAARALKNGVSDFVRKPFSSEELFVRISSILKNARYQQHIHEFHDNYISDRPRVSVIIPTLNEAENLPLLLPYLPMDWIDEVLLIDGRSTDGTVEIAKRILPSIKIILEAKSGKGIALRTGYHAATGDILIVIDADGSHDPREIPRYITALLEGADFVKGSRFTAGGGTTDMPFLRQLGNYGFVQIVNLLFGCKFSDLCYGFHAFWSYCLDSLDLCDFNGFEIDTAIYLHALTKHLRLIEVPSFEGYRFRGKGKLRTFPDGYRVLKTILRQYIKKIRNPSNDVYIGFRGQQFGQRIVLYKNSEGLNKT